VFHAPLRLNSPRFSRDYWWTIEREIHRTTQTWLHLPIGRTARTTLRPPTGQNNRFFGRSSRCRRRRGFIDNPNMI
jgi:hypothetical protein